MNTKHKAVCHIDANYFYGQIEAIYRPAIRGKPFVVGGDQETRKGIVLTKSPEAKKMGVKTGSSIRDALGIYPSLLVIPANYPLYMHFSQRMREIVLQHTDTIRPFGSDEMWAQLYGDKRETMKTIDEIRKAIWRQLCMTVSIGVGDNLPYAKLGSDLAANNSVCEVWTEDKERVVYPLPASDLLYCGPKTAHKLMRHNINTIGDIANTDPKRICEILRNRTGESLWVMASGLDRTAVAQLESVNDVKSIGNSNTMPRDLHTEDDVKAAFYMLCESVSERMRTGGFEARTIKISVRDNELLSFERQAKLARPTNLTKEMVPAAMELFKRNYFWGKPIRSLGIRGADLVPEGLPYQLELGEDTEHRQKMMKLERFADQIRGRFGRNSLQRAVLLKDTFRTPNANNSNEDAQVFYQY